MLFFFVSQVGLEFLTNNKKSPFVPGVASIIGARGTPKHLDCLWGLLNQILASAVLAGMKGAQTWGHGRSRGTSLPAQKMPVHQHSCFFFGLLSLTFVIVIVMGLIFRGVLEWDQIQRSSMDILPCPSLTIDARSYNPPVPLSFRRWSSFIRSLLMWKALAMMSMMPMAKLQ